MPAIEPPHVYTFVGRVHPEWGGWWFDLVRMEEPGGVEFSARMKGSQFTAELKVPAVFGDDPLTAKNVAETHVRTIVNVIGFYTGTAIDCEVMQMLADRDWNVVSPTIRELAEEYSVEEFRRLVEVAFRAQSVRLGLADLRPR